MNEYRYAWIVPNLVPFLISYGNWKAKLPPFIYHSPLIHMLDCRLNKSNQSKGEEGLPPTNPIILSFLMEDIDLQGDFVKKELKIIGLLWRFNHLNQL
jgi:hypothetical protein